MILLLMRFCSGDPLDGRYRTNATWLRQPDRVLDPRGRVFEPWHWRPGWHRTVVRLAPFALAAWALAGWLSFAVVMSAAALAAAAHAGIRVFRWLRAWRRAFAWDGLEGWQQNAKAALTLPVAHYREYRQPLKAALRSELGTMPGRLAIAPDRSRVTLALPAGFAGAEKQAEAITRVVTNKLALEVPEVAWKHHGRRPRVTFTLCDPPPKGVTWEDIAADIAAAKPAELVSGVGKRAAIVKVSIELDSPHFGIISGTGGGKSTLAAFWLLQALRRGDIALVLDAKRFSHPWTFKDMDAEYDQLPNVAYCRTVRALHDAMCWLGAELDERNKIAERTINAKGTVTGNVGPRLWIIAEEMNLAHGALKQYWAAIRDPDQPKRSPAFTGLGAVSFAGRAVKMHLVPIGQMLRAEVLGGSDVRENIGVRMLTRYTANSWKMQAGDIPMPPPPSNPGRWQQLASGEVNEVQVPLVDMEQARDLATGGIVTQCPDGMPGRAGVVSVRRLALPPGAADQGFVVGHAEEVAVGLTIAEALADGIFGPLSLDAARRRVHRAGLQKAGRRGDGSYTYARADLFAAARDGRRKETAA